MKIGTIFRLLAFPIAAGALAAVYKVEKMRPLRDSTESKPIRTARNLALAATAAGAMYFLEKPVAARVASTVERNRIGLLKIFRLPRWLEMVVSVVLLDYTLYLWHVLTHRVGILWHFHVVHHIDADLDASTGLRFHFGEIVISVVWRAAQVLIIGVSPDALKVWQTILLPLVVFHHSNIELPNSIERVLSKVLVTPRLHGIHHSVVQSETDSNWSSGLSVWDRLHGTFRDIGEHDGVVIGVPAFRRLSDLELLSLIEMPFFEQRPSWELPPACITDER
ncbi:MAG: sterol desaturase family protein [Acidobacteriota bacterium]